MTLEGKRIADDGIYLNEGRTERPKETFVQLGDLIDSRSFEGLFQIYDVGCATGEFIHYLNARFPDARTRGIDVSAKMIEQAGKENPQSIFTVGSALDSTQFENREFDVVSCSGVFPIFDDIEVPLENLLSCVRKGGSVLINSIVNDDPVDMIMRYRHSNVDGDGEWETGWNIFSKQTFEKLLAKSDRKLSWTWHPFQISFPMEKREDPMRTWTIETEQNPRQLINGACLLVNMQFLHIIA